MRGSSAAELLELRQWMADGSAQTMREALGLGMTEAGRAAAVDASTIWRWERGRRRPSGPAAVRYHRVLRRLATRQGVLR